MQRMGIKMGACLSRTSLRGSVLTTQRSLQFGVRRILRSDTRLQPSDSSAKLVQLPRGTIHLRIGSGPDLRFTLGSQLRLELPRRN